MIVNEFVLLNKMDIMKKFSKKFFEIFLQLKWKKIIVKFKWINW